MTESVRDRAAPFPRSSAPALGETRAERARTIGSLATNAAMRGALALLVIQMANALLSYGVTAGLTHVLSPGEFGRYSFVLALVSTLVLPAQFGIPSLLVREIAAASARNAWGSMKGLVRRAHQFAVLMGVVVGATAGIAQSLVPGLRGAGDVPTFMWSLTLVPLLPLSAVRAAMLRGLRRPALGQFPEQVLKPGLLLLALTLAPRWINVASRAMALNAATTAIAFAVGWWLFLLYRPAEFQQTEPRFESRRWLRSMLPLGVSSSMSLLQTQIGILILGFIAAPAEAGVYRVASQTALLVGLGYSALNAALSPEFAHAHARGDRRALERTAILGSRWSLAVGIPLSVLFWVRGEEVLGRLFGSAYVSAAVPLSILVLTFLVSMALGSAAALLNMTHHERDVTACFIIAAVVHIVASIPLVFAFGMIGAAWATVLASLVLNGMLWIRVKQRLTIECAFWGRLHAG